MGVCVHVQICVCAGTWGVCAYADVCVQVHGVCMCMCRWGCVCRCAGSWSVCVCADGCVCVCAHLCVYMLMCPHPSLHWELPAGLDLAHSVSQYLQQLSLNVGIMPAGAAVTQSVLDPPWGLVAGSQGLVLLMVRTGEGRVLGCPVWAVLAWGGRAQGTQAWLGFFWFRDANADVAAKASDRAGPGWGSALVQQRGAACVGWL